MKQQINELIQQKQQLLSECKQNEQRELEHQKSMFELMDRLNSLHPPAAALGELWQPVGNRNLDCASGLCPTLSPASGG